MKNTNSTSTPSSGDILIAHPEMTENLFSQTLVYLHTFSEEGALGFILNRPLGQTLENKGGSEAVPELLHHLPLFFGGPVQADHFILAHFTPKALSNGFQCEMNPDPEELKQSGSEQEGHLRAFMGYAGWSAGQLEEELARNDWEWIPADIAFLKESPGDDLWDLVSSGDQRWRLLRSFFPEDAEKN